MKLRRKGVALLYYLALEGPVRRERMAELLWGHGKALGNLRVEIHRLREQLAPYAIQPFDDHADPLRLRQVSLDPTWRDSVVMEGLDDISPSFQDWLDRQRLRDHGAAPSGPREALVEELAKSITLPFVLVLSGEPGSGRAELARDLARKLGLPFVEGSGGTAPTMNYLVAEDQDQVAPQINTGAEAEKRLWVIERSLFGEEPELLLQLRATTPPERMRFVTLDHLRWWETKQLLPKGLPFAQGSALHLASTGNLHYLRELLKLYDPLRPTAPLPVPLRMRATYLLEARRLTDPARRALESASICSGPLTSELVSLFGLEPHLDELERTGWLGYDESGWYFRSEGARRLLEGQLPQGVRSRLETLFAGTPTGRGSTGGRGEAQMGTLSEPRMVEIAPGPEAWLGEHAVRGKAAMYDGRRLNWSHIGALGERSQVRIATDGEPLLIRLRGRMNLVSWSEGGRATQSRGTLGVRVGNADARPVRFGPQAGVGTDVQGVLWLPLEAEFDRWLLAPATSELVLESCLTNAIIQMRVAAYTPLDPVHESAARDYAVRAFALGLRNPAHSRVSVEPSLQPSSFIAGVL